MSFCNVNRQELNNVLRMRRLADRMVIKLSDLQDVDQTNEAMWSVHRLPVAR